MQTVLKFICDSFCEMIMLIQIDLEIFCPKLIHVTCLAYALNLAAEVIRNQNEDDNCSIFNVKKVFLKVYFRIQAGKPYWIVRCLQNLFWQDGVHGLKRQYITAIILTT